MSLRTRLVLGVLVLAVVGLVSADVGDVRVAALLPARPHRPLARDAPTVSSRRHCSHGAASAGRLRTRSGAPGVYIQIRKPDGKVIFTGMTPSTGHDSASAPVVPAKITLRRRPANDGWGRAAARRGDRARYLTVPAKSGGGHYRVRASIDPRARACSSSGHRCSDVQSTLGRLLLIELLVTAAVLAAIFGLGLWIVRIGLRPLRRDRGDRRRRSRPGTSRDASTGQRSGPRSAGSGLR